MEHYKQCPYEKNLRRVLDENSLDILIKKTPQKIIPCQFHILHNQNIGQYEFANMIFAKKEKKKETQCRLKK